MGEEKGVRKNKKLVFYKNILLTISPRLINRGRKNSSEKEVAR